MDSIESLNEQIIHLKKNIQNSNEKIEQYSRQVEDFKKELSHVLSQTTSINKWIFLKFGVSLNENIEDIVYTSKESNPLQMKEPTTPSTLEVKEKSKSDKEESYNEKSETLQIVEDSVEIDSEIIETTETEGDEVGSLVEKKQNNEKIIVPKRGRPKNILGKDNKERKRLPVQCDQCGKILKGESSLKSHKLIHTNIRPWECSLCSKKFRRKHHLDFHILIHKGEEGKTKMCHFCSKSFFVERDLNRHVRTHTREKPFACQICPKSFNVKQHLILHLRTHTGEKPYKCDTCGKTFTQANSLRLHKKIHLRDLQGSERAIR